MVQAQTVQGLLQLSLRFLLYITNNSKIVCRTAFSPNDHANFGLRLGRLIAPELSPEQLHHAIDRLLTPSERSQLPTAAAPAVLPTLSPAAYAPPAPVSSGDPESAEPEARLEFGHACRWSITALLCTVHFSRSCRRKRAPTDAFLAGPSVSW